MGYLLYVLLCIAFPVVPAVVSFPAYGEAFLKLMNWTSMGVADFLGCYVTVASGAAFIIPTAYRASKGDVRAKDVLMYVAPAFGAVLSGILSIMLASVVNEGARFASYLLGGICVWLSIVALVVYIVKERGSWVPKKSG